MTSADDTYGYMIAFHDPANSYYTYAVPNLPGVPRVLYTSFKDAKRALLQAVTTFNEFTPVAYGKAYPYEDTTFENQLDTTGFGLLGWITVTEDDESARVPVGLLRFPYA
jgi:hypothetical protein